MAKEVTLIGSYMYKGRRFGPGTVTVPDDAFMKLAAPKEKALLDKAREEGSAAIALLPSGHPYHVLFAQLNAQPPEFTGEATRVAQPATITPLEETLLTEQVGEGDSEVEVPAATTSGEVTTTGTRNAAPGTPRVVVGPSS